jgi:PQQ-dependent catabolism-associated CXXCW motif protein
MRLFSFYLLLFCLVQSAPALSADDQAFFSPEGYRVSEFRSPVPASVPGAEVVSTDAVRRLLSEPDTSPTLIDVLPAPLRPEGLPATSLWLPPDHNNIPGSVWLPNVGFGRLSDALDAYFRDNLVRLTGGNRDRPILIYCLADCWMSWNAAKRAAQEYGYTRIYWYPEGTTGWEAAGLPLEKCRPVPMD